MLRTLALALTLATAAQGDPAIVEAVRATETAPGTWRFDVTVRHPDTGWDHYADAWEVRAPDGTVLGTRELLHPHETEQPFTRSLTGVAIGAGITTVIVQARCSIDGWSGPEVEVTLP